MKKLEVKNIKIFPLLGAAALAGLFLTENGEKVLADNVKNEVANKKSDLLKGKIERKVKISEKIIINSVEMQKNQGLLDSVISEKKQVENSLEKLNQEKENLFAELAVLEKKETELKTTLEAKKANLQEVNDQLDQLTKKQTDIKKQIEDVKGQIEVKKTELAQKQTQLKDLQAKLAKVEENESSESKSELADLLVQKKNADRAVTDYAENKSTWESELVRFQKNEPAALAEFAEFKDIPKAEMTVHQKVEYKQAKEKLDFIQSKIRTFNNLLKFRLKAAEEAKRLLEEINPKIELLQKQNNDEKEKINKEISAVLADLKNDDSKLEADLQQLNARLATTEEEIGLKLSLEKEAEKDVSNANVAVLEQNKQVAKQKNKINQNKDNITDTTNKLSQLAKVESTAKNKAQSLIKEKLQLQQELENMNQEIHSHLKELDDKKGETATVDEGVQTEEIPEAETKEEETQTTTQIQDEATQVEEYFSKNTPELVVTVPNTQVEANLENNTSSETKVLPEKKTKNKKQKYVIKAKKKAKTKVKVKIAKGKFLLKHKNKWQKISLKKLISLAKKNEIVLFGKAKLVAKGNKISVYTAKGKKMHKEVKAGKTVRIHKLKRIGKKTFVQFGLRKHLVLVNNLRFK